jgi:2-polyprenyl-6-methoxyphenol hydroxylase-like FAD-dependent oxidoreductase
VTNRVLIIGGGVGGLAAAIQLRKAGVDAVAYEQQPEVGKLGSGFFLWSNAFRALQLLGVAERAEQAGVPVDTNEFRHRSGKLQTAWPVADLTRKLGAPTVGMRRAVLQGILGDALDPEGLVLGAKLTGFDQDGDGVTARFADGREERGDLLIGADGVNSAVRAQVLGDGKPRYAGYAGWRAIVDYEADLGSNPEVRPGLFRLYSGRGSWFLYYHVAPGKVYWLGLGKAPEDEQDPPQGARESLLARYEGFAEPVPSIIQSTPETEIWRAPMVDRDPSDRWGEGRVTLLGDAAHPMTPNGGRGAGQALEDAVVLAKVVAEQGAVESALRDYEHRRMERTKEIVLDARGIGARGIWTNPVRCAIRDRIGTVILKKTWTRQERDLAYDFH